MSKFVKGVKEVNPILVLLLIVIILGIIFFLRVNLSINKESPTTGTMEAKGNTATTTTHEADVFNTRFKTFQGLNVGSYVKSMILSINNSNKNSSHKIAVNFEGTEYKDDDIKGLTDKIENNASYNVKLTSYSNEGFIEIISINKSV